MKIQDIQNLKKSLAFDELETGDLFKFVMKALGLCMVTDEGFVSLKYSIQHKNPPPEEPVVKYRQTEDLKVEID